MILRSFILSLLFVFCSSLLVAQDSSSSSVVTYTSHEYFPKKGDFGTTILLTGLIDNIQLESPKPRIGENILFARYYLEDDMVLRMGLGVNLSNVKVETADSVGLTLIDTVSTTRRFTINVSGGIEKHLQSSNRLDPYVFGQMNLTFIGKENTEINITESSAAGEAKTERVIKEDGGFGLGLVLGGGLNYFVAKRFSLGTELGLVLQYSSIGGTRSDNTIVTPINGNTISDFKTSDSKVTLTEIDVMTTALINISYFF